MRWSGRSRRKSRSFAAQRGVSPTGALMRRSTRRAWLFLGFATLAWPVYAHAPYEHAQATVTDPAGRRLQVVARYTDGIIGADPVTVMVRDAAGMTVAETESARDAIVRCPSYDS